jgi:hypothetical protein
MSQKAMIGYHHWQRFDGSFDSICPYCIAIVAHADDEAELVEKEKDHICDPATFPEYPN